eukprot:6173543-Pleurochrysis_carterae.AAC.5
MPRSEALGTATAVAVVMEVGVVATGVMGTAAAAVVVMAVLAAVVVSVTAGLVAVEARRGLAMAAPGDMSIASASELVSGASPTVAVTVTAGVGDPERSCSIDESGGGVEWVGVVKEEGERAKAGQSSGQRLDTRKYITNLLPLALLLYRSHTFSNPLACFHCRRPGSRVFRKRVCALCDNCIGLHQVIMLDVGATRKWRRYSWIILGECSEGSIQN